jgi:putative Holliday junction resolvase
VDQAAAVVILQNALDAERGTGRAPGTLVALEQGDPHDPAAPVKESE